MVSSLRPRNRLFVALDLPAEVRERLAGLGRDLAERFGGRAVESGDLHVTVDFLGRVPPEAAEDLDEALRAALGASEVTLRTGAAVARPRAGAARLVAVEFEDIGGYAGVARRVREATALALGRKDVDTRVWPHVTIVRFRRPTRVAGFPRHHHEHVFDIPRASLYDSVTAPGRSPRYEELLGVTLGTHAQRSPSNG